MRSFVYLLLTMMSLSSWAKVPGVTDKEIIIGGHTSESGKFAVFAPVGRAASAYFDMINEQGGVHGRKIKYIRIDTQGEHVQSVQVTKKLIEEDGVFAFFLAIGATHKSVYKYILEKNVPDFFFSDGLTEYSKPVNKLLYPGLGSAPVYIEGNSYGTLAVENSKGKKICFIGTDDEMGEQFIGAAKEAIESGNKNLKEADKLKIGVTERADRAAAQANTQVLNLKKANCEVVINGLFGNLGPSSLTYAGTQGFKPKWMILSWNVGPKFLELVPADVREGIYSVTTLATDSIFGVAGWNNFVKLMEKNSIPLHRAHVGYAAAETFVEILKRAGKDLTRESLITAAETMAGYKCGLCLAPLELSPTTHVPFSKPAILVTKSGQWTRL